MPSNLPSSFASAAAGQNANRDARGGRSDGRGSAGGEWSRRDGRSANGTLTFRRSSTTPLSQTSNLPPANDNAVQPPSVEAPIAQPTTYEVGPSRYTKDDLLEMYHSQRPSGDPSHLFISGWDPSNASGAGARGWGKSNENHVPQDPGTCWDANGDTTPIGLQGFSQEEKEAFSSDINSPLKPPTQTKETHQAAVNGRKPSVSHAPGNTFGVNSPSSAVRPTTRRRETVDSNPFSPSNLASPTATSRFSRDDPLWFSRKSGDLRESENDDPDTEQASRDVPKLPIGGLMRSNTSTGVSMGSMWPSSSSSGAGAFGNFALPTSPAVGDKRPGGATGGSRLAHLIPKDNAEGTAGKSSEAQNPLAQQSWRTRPRTDTDPFGGDEELSGSAVLGGAQDVAPGGPQPPNRAGILGTPIKGSTGDFGMSGLNLGGPSAGDNGPVSPSETNPYRSPPAERHDHDAPDSGAGEKMHGSGHEQPHSNYSTLSRSFAAAFDGSDRSQTSSVGAKAYLSGWPAPAGPSTGTPDRERSNFGGAFGSSFFSPIGDIQSPGLGNLGGVFGPSNTGSIGRGSKLGSLFPPAMQAQMQAHEHESSLSDSLGDLRQSNPLGAIGRGNFTVPSRDTDSPMRSNRGVFEELFPSSDNSRNLAAFGTSDAGQPNIAAAAAPQSFTPVSGGLPFGNAQPGVEPPSAQVRQMVMPDRMRWVYLDPQGQIQGPFTGLEMNDWYKANFFTPDLRVKKVEDPEFEPLGQLIRRIGNSREPFLVPQIGIAHGPPMQSGPFGPGTGSGIIPPLSGVFPTFGRTLTAEEQNNLERRKQEEQFLMAQQRDFMMRQQAMAKFQIQPSLQHHSSAHSLQSQPSFGSMTSPLGVPQQQHHQLPHQPPIGPMGPAGVFDTHPGANPAALRAALGNGDLFRPEDLANLSANERQMLASLQGEPAGTESGAPQPIGTPGDASLRYGLPEANELKEDDEGFKDRLKEFEDLRAEHDAEQAAAIEEPQESSVKLEETTVATITTVSVEPQSEPAPSSSKASKASKKKTIVEEASLSLTQQVQKTQASVAAAAAVPPAPQPAEPGMPMPFPPPASTTPLPAPTAQRARSNLPEQFNRSQTATPDAVAQPPPLAPWAKEPGQEGQKGPSLKEIQEAEARKAAKAEEAAAALRKAAMEQEAALLREKEKSAAAAAAAAANAGLPATSTWGQSSPVSATSPWAKPGATKAKGTTPNVASGVAGAKKTLAEIQREEEARKQKLKEVAVQTGGGAPVSTAKSYANLAGKPNHGSTPTAASPVSAAAGSGWATVGAGGKVKSPSTVPSQIQSRSVSTTSVKPVLGAAVKLAPKSIITSVSARAEPTNAAMDEFNKWAYRELSRGITGVNDITSFQADLAVLPLDTGLIADAVYANSTTMDGRHFAEEYVRRKKLAEKGVVEKQTQAESKASSASGGWNEVAKKSSAAQPRESEASMQSADFKVVPGRKKSKK